MIAAGVGLHHAGIDGKALALPTLHPCRQTPPPRISAGYVAVAEAAVTITNRKRRMVGHLIIEIEPAEPAIGQMQIDLLAQPPLEADAIAIANNQHPDHEFWDQSKADRPRYRR